MKEKCFIVFLVLCLIVFVFGGCKNNMGTVTTTETITESTAVVTTEETTEKKDVKTTAEATTDKKIVETKAEEIEVSTTKYVAPITTTKEQEFNTTKPVTTTKRPVETQVIKEPSTKAPTTTKKPTTTQAEYYPALTQADIEEIKQYTINYIQSKGQRVRSTLTWDNAGFSAIDTVPTDLSIRGDMFKRNGGVDPVEWVKGRMRERIDIHIEDWERQNGEGTIGGLYPLVKLENGYWNFTLGYC